MKMRYRFNLKLRSLFCKVLNIVVRLAANQTGDLIECAAFDGLTIDFFENVGALSAGLPTVGVIATTLRSRSSAWIPTPSGFDVDILLSFIIFFSGELEMQIQLDEYVL